MFYIVFWFIKQIYYILKRFTKHKILLLCGVGLLVYFLLANNIFGYDSYIVNLNGTDYTVHQPNDTVLNALHNLPLYSNGDYFYLTRQHVNGERTIGFIYKPSLSDTYKIYTKFTTLGGRRVLGYYMDNSSNILVHSYGINNNNGSVTDYGEGYIAPNTIWLYTTITSNLIELIANCNIFYETSGNTMLFSVSPTVPYIVNADLIPSWTFSPLIINGVNLDYDLPVGYNGHWNYYLQVNYRSGTFTIPINSFISHDSNNSLNFKIPQDIINPYLRLEPNTNIIFTLVRRNTDYSLNETFDLGTYTITLSQTDTDNINNNTEGQVQGSTSQALQEISESINDSSVDFSLSDLPQDSSEDITRDGINNIFTSIYNAFCTGSAQDIVLPIPYSNSNITIPANYVRSSLQNANANIIILIIEAFWWYLISRYIITDILKKITKIKSGDVEHLQDDNIKGDML